jgi:hypothetical protein
MFHATDLAPNNLQLQVFPARPVARVSRRPGMFHVKHSDGATISRLASISTDNPSTWRASSVPSGRYVHLQLFHVKHRKRLVWNELPSNYPSGPRESLRNNLHVCFT